MIKIENINKYFNRYKKNQIHVIDNTSLTLGDAGLVALLGPSGSGKTTLLNVIGGLDKVQKGKIYTYTFPNKFLDNLTSSRIVTKVSATTIVVRPTDYGDITLYCDGGSINFKIAPGLTIEVGDS